MFGLFANGLFGFNRPYVYNPYKEFTPIYLPGENYSFYINSDIKIGQLNPAFFRAKIIDVDGNTVYTLTGGLLQVVYLDPSNVTYHIYVNDFLFPLIKDGYYYIVVYDPVNSLELCRTNPILVSSNCVLNTTYVKFRHNDQLYGVRYDLLPDFYQKFRLPINQIKAPEIRSERVQYRQSSNGRELRNSKSFRDIVLTLEFYFANDDDFSALSAMLEHSEIYITGNKIIDMSQVKIDKIDEKSNQGKGTFEVIVDDYHLDRTSYENYGDFLLWGGNNYNVLNTFMRG